MSGAEAPMERMLAEPARGYWALAWQRLRRDPITMVALLVFAGVCLLTLLAPLLAQEVLHTDPNRQFLAHRFQPPGPANWLGTDEYGRDNLTRVLYAGQVSLTVGFTVAVVSLTLGVAMGLISGFFGGLVDDVTNAIIQTMLNIPGFFLLILLSVTFRPNIFWLAAFIGALGWMGAARQVRGVVLSVKQRPYVEAAQSIGAGGLHIVWRHILPNVTSIIIVVAGFDVAGAVLAESGLSYLGLGVQPPTASWGNMLNGSLDYIRSAWWLVAAPGFAIFTTVLCIFLCADGLRDALDPWTK
ncbi:MAG: ABC transporter permease [Chloroflexi bacterium]|nr:ABC transporter permease [Chloroflexota bacterium]